jgi:hypothetical protein
VGGPGRCGDPCWLTASIHLHNCQGAAPLSTLSSRPERSVGRDLLFHRPAQRKCRGQITSGFRFATHKLQIPPLRRPGFPVEVVGVGELHAAFFTECRTRGHVQRCVAGNPGALRSGCQSGEWRCTLAVVEGMDRTSTTATTRFQERDGAKPTASFT